MSNANVASLAFLTELPKVDSLSVYNSHIADATGIFSPRLKWWLSLSGNTVDSWGSFEGLKAKKLSDVTLSYTGLTDLSFMEGFSFTTLYLSGNDIKDITPLTKAKQIQKLSLSGNPVADFSPLSDIKGLKSLNLDYTGLTDLSFVDGLALTSLWLNGNDIKDISPLAKAKQIQQLSLNGNAIADFSPLAGIKPELFTI